MGRWKEQGGYGPACFFPLSYFSDILTSAFSAFFMFALSRSNVSMLLSRLVRAGSAGWHPSRPLPHLSHSSAVMKAARVSAARRLSSATMRLLREEGRAAARRRARCRRLDAVCATVSSRDSSEVHQGDGRRRRRLSDDREGRTGDQEGGGGRRTISAGTAPSLTATARASRERGRPCSSAPFSESSIDQPTSRMKSR